MEQTSVTISSLIDTWLLLRDIELNGERNRGLYILKSRGMAHSNQIREFLLTENGVQLTEVYLGPEGVLTGSARLSQKPGRRQRRCTAAWRSKESGENWHAGNKHWKPKSPFSSCNFKPTRKKWNGLSPVSRRIWKNWNRAVTKWLVVARPIPMEFKHRRRRVANDNTDQLERSRSPNRGAEVVATATVRRRTITKSVAAFANLKRLCEEHLPVNSRSK